MRQAGRFLLTLTLAASSGSPAAAEVSTSIDGLVRFFCSDAEDSQHPTRTELIQEVFIDDFASFDRTGLLFDYIPAGADPSGRGVIRAVSWLFKADGTRRVLGTQVARQNRVTGEAFTQKFVPATLEPGDSILWRFKFRNFDPLDPGECYAVLAGIIEPPGDSCGPYPDWTTSEYVLPYAAGSAYVISQGNCVSIGSHQGPARYAYDFAMPIGTEILAVRGGVVDFLLDSKPDGTGSGGDENLIRIRHDDGTYANYVHLTQGGGRVSVGDVVEQGQPIALSGNSGSTSGLPHLHLQLHPCTNRNVCGTLPITFRNTSANPNGLIVGGIYRATEE